MMVAARAGHLSQVSSEGLLRFSKRLIDQMGALNGALDLNEGLTSEVAFESMVQDVTLPIHGPNGQSVVAGLYAHPSLNLKRATMPVCARSRSQALRPMNHEVSSDHRRKPLRSGSYRRNSWP